MYCDQYLELAKARLADPSTAPAQRVATWQVLVWALDRYLRLLHPVMPFLTEAIWQRLPHSADDPELLIVAAWPDGTGERAMVDATQAAATAALLDLVRAVRNARAEAGITPGERLAAELRLPDSTVRAAYAALAVPFGRLARLGPLTVAEGPLAAGGEATSLHVLAGGLEAVLQRSGGDVTRARARLAREMVGTQARLAAAEARLADDALTARAPAAVVEGTRARVAELREQAERLADRLR
jgi:valyl-tRNA synthetase